MGDARTIETVEQMQGQVQTRRHPAGRHQVSVVDDTGRDRVHTRGLLAATYPAVQVDADALYVDEGQLLTSAGASAGLDLCLHLVARDYGSAAAADAARLAVTPLHRRGGQAQFIIRNRRISHTELDGLLVWIEHNAHLPLTLRDIAHQASSSERTLNRRFKHETGQTPMQWVNSVRIRHAQQLLETTSDSIERISRRAGFASTANFREQFRRLAGVSPQSYRHTFRDQGSQPRPGPS